MHERRRRRAERFEQSSVQCLVRPVVVPAHDVRDAEVDVVDDRREVVRRRSVLSEQRDAVEAVAEALARRAMALLPLARADRPLVPLDTEPLEVAHDRLLASGDVPARIGVVDPEQHRVAESAVRDRAERVADVERAGGARREPRLRHAVSLEAVPWPP